MSFCAPRQHDLDLGVLLLFFCLFFKQGQYFEMTDSSKCVFDACVRMFCFVSVHGIDFVDLSWERKRFTHENCFDMCPCTVFTDDRLIVLG